MDYIETLNNIRKVADLWFEGEYTEEKGKAAYDTLEEIFSFSVISDIYSVLSEDAFNKEQTKEVLLGFVKGLNKEQVMIFADARLNTEDMEEVMARLIAGETIEQCEKYVSLLVSEREKMLIDSAVELLYDEKVTEDMEDEAFSMLDNLYDNDTQQEVMWAYYENGFTKNQMKRLLEPGLNAEGMEEKRREIRGRVDTFYDEKLANPIKEVFEKDSGVIEKLYESMISVEMTDEVRELFVLTLGVMQSLKDRSDFSDEICKNLEKQLAEFRYRPGFKEITIDNLKEALEVAKQERNQFAKDLKESKENILTGAKKLLAEYTDKGKIAFMKGVSTFINGIIKLNYFIIGRQNVSMEEYKASFESYAKIERELLKADANLKNFLNKALKKDINTKEKSNSKIVDAIRKNAEEDIQGTMAFIDIFSSYNDKLIEFKIKLEEKTLGSLNTEKGKEEFAEVVRKDLTNMLQAATKQKEKVDKEIKEFREEMQSPTL